MRFRQLLAITLVFTLASHVPAQQRKEPLVDQVKKSIDRAVNYLKTEQRQRQNRSWEITSVLAEYEGAGTSLALLALLNAGVPVTDPAVKDGLAFLRTVAPSRTYVRALQTMVFVEAGQVEDKERIQNNVHWLVKARVIHEQGLAGWTYDQKPVRNPDGSNSQYALLGLWAGRQGGAAIDRSIWQEIYQYYLRTQEPEGNWNYHHGDDQRFKQSKLTMTPAGICGLIIASMELNVGREKFNNDGSASNCGVYSEDPAIARALGWLSVPERFKLDPIGHTFYNLYGLERLGRLSGQRFLAGHDWYREGCDFLVKKQRDDGSWSASGAHDGFPLISTSFALIFLSKGRTPVLISKLVHGELGRRDDTDWNNDRNDLANLVKYSSDRLFKNLPLAWQSFDMMRAAVNQGKNVLTDEDLLDVTSDLLQAPIVYLTGHKSPRLRFTAVEKELLKRYIDNGGFLLVEACCNSPAFDQGFKALAGELWPDDPLEPLDENHAIWRSFETTKPGQPYTLMGINRSCKTVVVYCPQDLSCQWENNEQKTPRGEQAFKLGANIVAYATGMEPPRPRLTHVELASTKDDKRTVPRGFFKVGQLKHRGDWQAAPRAMPNLMDDLRKRAGLDVTLKTEDLPVASKSVIDFKFLYMHGRSEFTFTTEQVKFLRFNLETGGLLLADSCCGKPVFDKSFRQFVKVLFPEHKLQEVPLDDPLFGKELNRDIKLDEQTIKCRRQAGGDMRSVPPFLEGIKIDDRWVVLYSKYDIGCALERHKASDCLGYDPDSAFKIAGAAVLYLLELRP